MEINKQVKDSIFDFIVQRNLKNSSEELRSKGKFTIESQYELAINPKIKKYVFVVSEKIVYHNHSIEDKRYGVYAFDVKKGNYIKDFEEKGGCYIGFFNDLKIVEKII